MSGISVTFYKNAVVRSTSRNPYVYIRKVYKVVQKERVMYVNVIFIGFAKGKPQRDTLSTQLVEPSSLIYQHCIKGPRVVATSATCRRRRRRVCARRDRGT